MVDARAMWALFEPVHAVTYFAPQAREHFTAAGLRGYWRGYFAGRASPLGEVQAAPVVASFFSFAPTMVGRAIPEVWTMISPQGALQARVNGAAASLTPLVADLPDAHLAEAADLLTAAAGELEPAGRVLGAANAALPPYDQPLPRLWQAATTLREHRGGGHVSALVAAGIGACEVLPDGAWLAGHRRPGDAGWGRRGSGGRGRDGPRRGRTLARARAAGRPARDGAPHTARRGLPFGPTRVEPDRTAGPAASAGLAQRPSWVGRHDAGGQRRADRRRRARR